MEPEQVATAILQGFDEYRRAFREITAGAGLRFAAADWVAVQEASAARIELYRRISGEVVGDLGRHDLESLNWCEARSHFALLIHGRADEDLAETVYNTVYRKLQPAGALTDELAFVQVRLNTRAERSESLARRYDATLSLTAQLTAILEDCDFQLPFRDLEEDVANMVAIMRSEVPLLRNPVQVQFEVLKAVFYRNKGAYVVGRMMVDTHLFPIAIPLLNDGGRLYVDAIIWSEADLSLIFSFTRAYFMVDVDYPNELVMYLQQLLPAKKRSELYASLGFYKHGKTEFVKGFLNHLEHSNDQFEVAEGIKGLVMAVFTLPSYQVVFKVIRDRFSPSKNITREQVREAYYLVKTHDRVGRMADTQEFHHFAFPRDRFSDELLEYLQSAVASSLTITDDQIIISHVYTERLMTPLNLYISGLSDWELVQVLDEYGNAVKQLAAANIFPGDMLLKNFGVTRHGRVVFYDYDEICYLTEVNFRQVPEPKYPEDRLRSEPWYTVGPSDVFPEEFGNFLFLTPRMRKIFMGLHADLFEASYWQGVQEKIREQLILDVFPYRQKRRFLTPPAPG